MAPSPSPIAPTPVASFEDSYVPFPETFTLAYRTLDSLELEVGEAGADWHQVHTATFNTSDTERAEIHIYNAPARADGTAVVHGLLQWNDKQYPLLDLLPGMDLESPDRCVDICILEQPIAGNEEAKILARIPLMATGPGLFKYLFYDGSEEKRMYSFDVWGKVQGMDLTRDSVDEMVVVFEGIGNHSPDLFLMRWYEGSLEISESFLESLSAFQGYLAELVRLEDGRDVVRVSDRNDETIYADYRMKDAIMWERVENTLR
ncbi:hypothetical protein [Paenibacillus paeoniae]|uniref:Uncharacterized protein n=1 Tax=Paenibacillus paeoniae TaxID=2292705 RepID=A0A371PKE4_9BACL|nr:hypothetical protein [Paenibacillus paeoniae]REK76654.1 hypothetical protein DX130_06355 [Paenibacillus paeoniae]